MLGWLFLKGMRILTVVKLCDDYYRMRQRGKYEKRQITIDLAECQIEKEGVPRKLFYQYINMNQRQRLYMKEKQLYPLTPSIHD